MATTTTPTPTEITIDVTQDLGTLSSLKDFFTGQRAAIFSMGKEMVKYRGQPVQSAAGSSPSKLTIQGDPSWTLPSGIAFSLSTDASCTVTISNASTDFSLTKSIDSTDTMDVIAGPTPGVVYINIDLDFDIKGEVSATGTFSGVGITGKASKSQTATLSYCHPVSGTLETVAALKTAFSGLIFPFQPDCALTMPVGSIGKVNFDGKLKFKLDVTYGLGDYQLSAQSLGLAQDSVSVAWDKLTPPSLDIDTGANASVSYTHSDHFCVIVQKTDAKTALLYLLRSADNETKESVGVTVGISATSVTATIDPAKFTNTIAKVTKNMPQKLASEISSHVPDLQSSLVSKANDWLSSKSGEASLAVDLSQQHGRAVLFIFSVDLSPGSPADLAKRSWTALMGGDLDQAMQIGGFTLQPGSGVSDYLKRSSTIQLQFFNFHLAKTTDFFQNSSTQLGPDDSIRFFADIGQEAQFSVNTATKTATIHFVATASEATKDNYQNAEVDLYIELSESNNPDEANKIANSVGGMAANATAQTAQRQMLDFVANNRSACLTLISIFKPSAYGKLACSPYTVDNSGKTHPPALPQGQDRANWNAFQSAVRNLMPDVSPVASALSYDNWMLWNVYSNYLIGDSPDANHVPDRRNVGNYNPAGLNLFADHWVAYRPFLYASTGFMNLCDDLRSLATASTEVTLPQQWTELLNTIQTWVKSDTDPDWSKPSLGALLYLCALGTYQVSADFQQATDNTQLTCTITLS